MRSSAPPTALCALALSLVLLQGCASAPAHKDPGDPFERVNRVMFRLDDDLAQNVAIPVGHAYQRVTPTFVRRGVANFFQNLHTPDVIVNDLLQAKFSTFAADSTRLVLNTTVGLGGLLDPATAVGLAKNDNDFGLTLGTWGVPPGPYLVLPLLGPSDIRDGLAKIPDEFAAPQNYLRDRDVIYGLYGLDILNTTTEVIIPTYQLLDRQNAFDRYAFARNAYLQRRAFLIHGDTGGAVDQQELQLEKSLQDDSDSGTPAPQAAPQK